MRPAVVAAAVACAAMGSAWAQSAGAPRAVVIEPSVSITQTITDNLRLTPEKSADAITQLTAGLRMSSRTGRVQGALDYALNGYVYARGSGRSDLQNTLNASGRMDVVDNWFSIDASAAITQQTISAFDVQGVDPALGSSNRTEQRSFQIAPSWRGTLAGLVDYRATIAHGASRSDARDSLGNSTTTSGSLTISGRRSVPFGWSATISRRQLDYDASRATEEDAARVSLTYIATPELQLSSSLGRERTNLTSLDKESNVTWGFGADWSPSPRTRLTAQQSHRSFGNSYNLAFEHRMPRTTFRLSSSRDIQDPSSPGSSRFGLDMDKLLAEIRAIPDPVLRNQVSRELGFLFGSATLQSRVDASVRYQGLRTSFSAIVADTSSSRLDPLAAVSGDLGQSDTVRQRLYSFGIDHRLTPVTSLGLSLSRQRNAGEQNSLSNVLTTWMLSLTTVAGPRANATVSARHVVFDSSTSPYTENAVVATYGLKF